MALPDPNNKELQDKLAEALRRVNAQPMPFYKQLIQNPRSPKDNGKYWRSRASVYSSTVDGASDGPGGAFKAKSRKRAQTTFTGRSDKGNGTDLTHYYISYTDGKTSVWGTLKEALERVQRQELIYQNLPHEGVRAGEVIGWRWWWVRQQRSQGIWLESLAHSREWVPGETVYGDVTKPVYRGRAFLWYAPTLNIYGGTYSFATKERALLEEGGFRTSLIDAQKRRDRFAPAQVLLEIDGERVAAVLGKIKMWGEIVEHKEGYRAEYAKILALDSITGTRGVQDELLLNDLRRRYVV